MATTAIVEVRYPRPEEVNHIIRHMRESDIEEVTSSHGPMFRYALRKAAEQPETRVGLVNGTPVALFGLEPGGIIQGGGTPWLVATDKLQENGIAFLKRNRQWVKEMHEKYGILSNYVYHRNTTSIAWLRWLGFDLHEMRPYGYYKRPFIRFSMGEAQCAVQQQPS